MKLTDVTSMLETIKSRYHCPYTYYSFPEKQAPKLPYITYYYPASSNMAADNAVYKRINELTIELYTSTKDFALEKGVESVLDLFGIVWDKSEDFLDTEHMFMITYETEIYIDGE